MPHPARDAMDACPHGAGHRDCRLTCKYNVFEAGELRIDSWELKCLDCGLRKTVAVRSDDEPSDEQETSPNVCPFCQFQATAAGHQLCDDANEG